MLTKMNEKEQLKSMREGLFQAFPNAERKGCAGPEVMRKIVARKLAVNEENKWVDHFAQCSPCSKEFFEIRSSYIRNKRVRTTAIAASAVLILGLGVWGWVRHTEFGNRGKTVAQVGSSNAIREQIVDLRNWSGERTDGGTERMPNGPLELHRWRTRLVIYLPSGSKPGKYEIEILENSRTVLTLNGAARIEAGNTVLRVPADLSNLNPGEYSMGFRQPPWDWRYLLIRMR